MPVDALGKKDGKKIQPQEDDAWGLDALIRSLKAIEPKKGDLTATLVGMTNVSMRLCRKSTVDILS